ncbi:hypothetical protein AALO_G00282350 [Alosa alosa]|uniref:Immunoglobulin domain-containing protein n=1 Tax=Alosa alosa TaxID=278164 RepID=A0AAV6FPC8_9TELE|nr:hypothetical protein AALO_G00282350 [Alosa alosa]
MRVFTSYILLLLSGVSWVCCVQTLNGSVGESVEISCEYPQEYDPMSVYLMKMSNREVVIELTKAHEKTYTKGRYTLYHDSENRAIAASIHNLSIEDAGTYRCASASPFDDDDKDYRYTEFRLEVEQAPPTSKPPLITGSTSAHSSPTGDTHSSRNTRAPELESTSAHGNSNTTQSGQNASLYGGLAAAVLVGLLVLTIILMKTRAKRRETPRSSLRNPSNAEENNGIYAEIQDTDSSADKLQTPPTPTNQRNHQDSSPVISIYTTANQNPEQHPASANQSTFIFLSLPIFHYLVIK